MKKLVVVFFSCLVFTCAQASTYFKGEIDPSKERNPNVSITMMRWGSEGGGEDRIILQVAADNCNSVSIFLESPKVDNKTTKLRIDSPVHVYGVGRQPSCTVCGRILPATTGTSVLSRGLYVHDACISEIRFPSDLKFSSVRIMDVQANGVSQPYLVKFTVDPRLMRSPMKVPINKGWTIHSASLSKEVVEASPATNAVASGSASRSGSNGGESPTGSRQEEAASSENQVNPAQPAEQAAVARDEALRESMKDTRWQINSSSTGYVPIVIGFGRDGYYYMNGAKTRYEWAVVDEKIRTGNHVFKVNADKTIIAPISSPVFKSPGKRVK